MFFFVFFKVKGGLFSCISLLKRSFISKFDVFKKKNTIIRRFRVEIFYSAMLNSRNMLGLTEILSRIDFEKVKVPCCITLAYCILGLLS